MIFMTWATVLPPLTTPHIITAESEATTISGNNWYCVILAYENGIVLLFFIFVCFIKFCFYILARSSLTTEKYVVIKNHTKHTNKTCEKKTSNRKEPYTLIEAINVCEFQNCPGVLDEDCDGKKIFLCADVFPAENDDPATNGCTYIKKGKLSLFTGLHDFEK